MLDGNSIEKTMRDGIESEAPKRCGYCEKFMYLDFPADVGVCRMDFDAFEDAHRGTCRIYEAFQFFSEHAVSDREECYNGGFEES